RAVPCVGVRMKTVSLAALVSSALATASCVSAPAAQPEADAAVMNVVADASGPAPVADAAGPVADTALPVADAAVGQDSALPTPFVDRVVAGTRLKPVYAKTAEGQRFFMLFWLDLEQKTTCSFASAEDGKQ